MGKLCLLLALFVFMRSSAQTPVGLPTCLGYDAGLIYIISQNQIYNYDPSLPVSATNPWASTVSGTAGCNIIAVGKNIYATTPDVTFYVTNGTDYYWYNGTSWVNSGFGPGAPQNSTFGGLTVSGSFLYGLEDSSVVGPGKVYKNANAGNGTLLTTVPGFFGTRCYNPAGDAYGDFFIFNSSNFNGYINEYSPAGALITSWTTSVPVNLSFAESYFGIIGTSVYAYTRSYNGNTSYRDVWKGTLSGSAINFILLDSIPVISLLTGTEAIATCPEANGLSTIPASVTSIKPADFNISPNPVNDELTVVTDNQLYSSYMVTDIRGDVVKRGVISKMETTIKLAALAPGNYFFKLTGIGGATNVKQFVKN